MRLRDKDRNQAEVGSVETWDEFDRPDYKVGISANGVWLTPTVARRFARAILKTADTVEAANKKHRSRR